MFYIEKGDITDAKTETILCIANSSGSFAKGTPKRIVASAGEDVSLEIAAKYQCDKSSFSVGSCFETSSGDLAKKGIKRISYMVISPFPGSLCSIYDVINAFERLLKMTIKYGRKSIAVPGIGIEDECLDVETVAVNMSKIIRNNCDRLDIHVIDTNEIFINKIEKYIN